MRPSLIPIGALVLALGATTCAAAQSPAATPARPAVELGRQLLQNQRMHDANSAYGTITYFKRFDMQLQNGPNSYRAIHLHQGTVIEPRGTMPRVGTTVSVSGYGRPDGSLEATRITVQR